MAEIDVRISQHSVIEILNAEGETPICIHERLKNVYVDSTEYVSIVRQWVHRCKEAEGQMPLAGDKMEQAAGNFSDSMQDSASR